MSIGELLEMSRRIDELEADRDSLKRGNTRLLRIIARELTENDELGSEFVYVNALREELKELKWRMEGLEK